MTMPGAPNDTRPAPGALPPSVAATWWKGHSAELAAIAGVSAGAGLLAAYANLYDRLDLWVRTTFHVADSQLHEVFFVLATAAAGFCVFAYRCWREQHLTMAAWFEAAQERVTIEAQMQQLQKIDAVGRVAGGIAHDFNNLLTVILGYNELIRARLEPESPLHEAVAEVQKAGATAARLTGQLLAFSRQKPRKLEAVSLAAVLSHMHGMLQRMIGDNVVLELATGPTDAMVIVDRGQIEQVIMNLAVNARDAMPGGGRLLPQTRIVTLAPEAAREVRPMVEPGLHVELTVTDTGRGMDAQTLERIFEPFFTTKGVGQGTGLGLATVYAIARQCGGGIRVSSAPGYGTTFTLYFPADAAEPAMDVAASDQRAAVSFSASNRI